MKFGVWLHAEKGIDAVFEEAKAADRQGYDSIWLTDHLINPYGGPHVAHEPFEALTLMTALAAVTTNVQLAWAVLSLTFRRPAVLAKSLATLDHISKGRVVCSVGAGWAEEEHEVYDLGMIKDHDERIQFGREAVRLIKQLWLHPAPERVTFEGKYFRARGLPFNPAPYQKPHPPIWWGGDSDASIATVKELADGWDMITSARKDKLAEVLGSPDWPKRPMTLVKTVRIYVHEKRDDALKEAKVAYDKGGGRNHPKTFEEYLSREIVGSPEECIARIQEIGSWGITHMRLNAQSMAQQERVARLVLPHFKARAPVLQPAE